MIQTTSTTLKVTGAGGGGLLQARGGKQVLVTSLGREHKISRRIYKREFPILHNRFRSEVQ